MRRSKKRTIGSVTGRRNPKTAGLTCVRICLNKLDPRAVHRARLLFPRAFNSRLKRTSFYERLLGRITIGYPTEVALINRYLACN